MYNINDRVRVKRWEEIDDSLKTKCANGNPHFWTPGKARTCGKVGTIVDKLYSEAYECYTYKLLLDGFDCPSAGAFDDDSFVLLADAQKPTYEYGIVCEDGVVIATLYDTTDGVRKDIFKAHGHIMHEGVNGYAQAASYALKKIYLELNGGTL